MDQLHMRSLTTGAILATLVALPVQAAGDGVTCLRVVHVAANDALNLRLEPDAGARIVDRMAPGRHGLIRKMDVCTPNGIKTSRQWCRVSHMEGGRIRIGWVKRHFIAPAPCPAG